MELNVIVDLVTIAMFENVLKTHFKPPCNRENMSNILAIFSQVLHRGTRLKRLLEPRNVKNQPRNLQINPTPELDLAVAKLNFNKSFPCNLSGYFFSFYTFSIFLYK